MKHAYSDLYLSDAQRTLAGSFEHAVFTYGYDLPVYYSYFLNTEYSSKFEKGDPFVISGMSGVELAGYVIEIVENREIDIDPVYRFYKGAEYWAGWALAYYQWYSGCTFKALNMEVPIETVLRMYSKYHEMDITQFVHRVEEIRAEKTNIIK